MARKTDQQMLEELEAKIEARRRKIAETNSKRVAEARAKIATLEERKRKIDQQIADLKAGIAGEDSD